jgi:diguanylate cyclase (GGDEF)-like protein
MTAENAEIQYYLKLLDMANRDGMLGIYNKKYLLEFMQSEFVRSKRASRDFSLIVLDLDFFKKVNDQHGHDAGDLVLKETARVVAKCARQGEDIVGRYGGEEFLILLPKSAASLARDVAERMRQTIEMNAYIYQTINIPITASLGVASRRIDDQDVIAIFKRADAALYESKRNGRNRVTCG